MKVSLGTHLVPLSGMGRIEANESQEIPPDNISVVFKQDRNRMNQKVEIYFVDTDRKVGRIQMSPFEFRRIWEQGLDVLHKNKVT